MRPIDTVDRQQVSGSPLLFGKFKGMNLTRKLGCTIRQWRDDLWSGFWKMKTKQDRTKKTAFSLREGG